MQVVWSTQGGGRRHQFGFPKSVFGKCAAYRCRVAVYLPEVCEQQACPRRLLSPHRRCPVLSRARSDEKPCVLPTLIPRKKTTLKGGFRSKCATQWPASITSTSTACKVDCFRTESKRWFCLVLADSRLDGTTVVRQRGAACSQVGKRNRCRWKCSRLSIQR